MGNIQDEILERIKERTNLTAEFEGKYLVVSSSYIGVTSIELIEKITGYGMLSFSARNGGKITFSPNIGASIRWVKE